MGRSLYPPSHSASQTHYDILIEFPTRWHMIDDVGIIRSESLCMSGRLFNKVARLRDRRLENRGYISYGNKVYLSSTLSRPPFGLTQPPTDRYRGLLLAGNGAWTWRWWLSTVYCRRLALYLHKRANAHSGNPLPFIKSNLRKTRTQYFHTP
jgi:hypothetical protein